MTTLTKAEACALLFISESTMTRRLKAGRYKATKQGDGKFAPLVFTYAEIGLTEPVAEVESSDNLSEHPEPETRSDSDLHADVGESSPKVPDITEPDSFSPREYRDSFGHALTGNAEHKMFASQPPAKKVATDDHMPEGLRTAVTGDGSSEDHPINQMMIRAGLMKPAERPMTDAEQRRFVDRAAWAAGLARGFSR